MILDILKNSNAYACLNLKFEKAFKFLEENDLENMQIGKYEIDGSDIFALVQAYTTKPLEEGKWETHKNYIDIQYIIRGSEIIGWSNLDGLKALQEYNPEKDITFFKEPQKWSALKLTGKHYGIFFPEDAHMPGISDETSSEVKKVVLKIKV